MAPGSRLGQYEIVAALGSGGMGEVYRAHDGGLKRDVALKVLPEAVARDSERMARFRREAQLLAALNHPHIAVVYGFADGALAMELVEGPTLAQRLGPGPMALEEALPLARQLCDAVEYAHDHGIVHRDLKPANIKLTRAGAVKVLDFGLAKALAGESAAPDLAESPTLSRMATAGGIILGTAAYMSPEQAKGKTVDRRTDIFAFGCVLYEMLAGGAAFQGETVTDILAAVVLREPDWTRLPAATPPRVRALLRRCLEKDPRQRLQAMGEARIALEAPEETDGAAPAQAARRAWLPWVAAALAVAVAAGVWLARPAPAPPPLRKPEIPVANLAADWIVHPEISPDGSAIAYVSGANLYLRRLGVLQPTPLAALSNPGVGPLFWSPDSQSVGFFDQGKLWRIAAAGGPPESICAVPEVVLGAAWTVEGTIYFSAWRGDVYRVVASGGDPQAVGIKQAAMVDVHKLGLLPDGRSLLMLAHMANGGGRIEVLDPAGAVVLRGLDAAASPAASPGAVPLSTLLADWDDPVYSPGGLMVFSRNLPGGGQLWAARMAPARRALTAAPFLVTDQGRFPSLAADGTLIYELPPPPELSQLVWVSRSGQVAGEVGAAGTGLEDPAVAPAGRAVAVVELDANGANIAIQDIARGFSTRLLAQSGPVSLPAWSRDGQQIVYDITRDIRTSMAVKRSDGAGPATPLGTGHGPQFSTEGNYLVFTVPGDQPQQSRPCYWRLSHGQLPAAAPAPTCLPQTVAGPVRLSPDEHYLAYAVGEAGQQTIFLTQFPSGEGRWQVSQGVGHEPVWSRDGRELYFVTDGAMMAVSVATQPALRLGAPVRLFALNGEDAQSSGYDVGPDGRFLMVKPVGAPPPGVIVVDQNWQAEFAGKGH